MNPNFNCGFECGVFAASAHFDVSSGSPAFSTTTVRSGARSLRLNPTAGIAAVTAGPVIATTAGGKCVLRIYIRFATLPDASTLLIADSADVSGCYFDISDNTLRTYANGNIGASGCVITTGQWYLVDLLMDRSFNGNAGVAVSARVDGTPCAQATNNAAGAPTTVLEIGNRVNVTMDVFFDDLLLGATGPDYPFGSGYTNHFVPTADGSHNVASTNDFERTLTGTDIDNATTTAYQLVDDVPLESGASVDWINMVAPPNATDYVECIFGPAPGIRIPTVPPRHVEVQAGIHQFGTGPGNMEIRIVDNGGANAMYSATAVAGVTTVAYKRVSYPNAVNGGGPWLIGGGGNGDFLDLRVRFGSPAALDVNPDQYFDCIMIEAEFSEYRPAFFMMFEQRLK